MPVTMNDIRALEAFRRCFGTDDDGTVRSNFMTSEPVAYGVSGRYAWELSTGSGIEPDTTLWGVTVILTDGTRTPDDEDDPSRMFYSEPEARDYISTL